MELQNAKSCDGTISSLKSLSILQSIDENGVVIVWDTKTHKQALFENTIGDKAEEFFFGDEKLIIKCEESLRAYDLTRGPEKDMEATGWR